MSSRKQWLVLVAVFIVLCGLYLLRHPHTNSRTLSAGSHAAAPEFSLKGLNGEPVELSRYHGKVVLLDFWATWCEPCRAEIPHFTELQTKYQGQGFQVIGISMDDGPKPVQEFYQQFKINYPVAMGNDKLAEQYGGILGLPVNFLIGRDGTIQAKYLGAADLAEVEAKIQSLLQQTETARMAQ